MLGLQVFSCVIQIMPNAQFFKSLTQLTQNDWCNHYLQSAWDEPAVPDNVPPPSERQKQQLKQNASDIKQQYQQKHGQQQKQEPVKNK